MAGAPSHLELFDYKPALAKFNGTLPPPELLKGYRAAFINPNSKLPRPEVQIRTPWQVRRGAVRVAAAHGDDRRTTRHRQVDGDRRVQPRAGPDHDEHRRQQFGRPSFGSWALYGLGSETQDLPGLRRV